MQEKTKKTCSYIRWQGGKEEGEEKKGEATEGEKGLISGNSLLGKTKKNEELAFQECPGQQNRDRGG